MVDRYILPIPKTIRINSNVHLKKYSLLFKLHALATCLFAFQFGRFLHSRTIISKPTGYFVDWNHPDAPKKIKYFS